MNKKVFLGLFAATGMLLATSCSQDEFEVPQSGNEAQVTFSLGLEGGHATRAISDGSGVDKLVYAVYKLSATNGEYELQPAVGSTNSQFVKDGFKSGDNVSIPLAKGQTYRVAFWAQNSSCDAYNTADLTAVSVDYADGDLNNDETRDAFFKTVEFKVEGSKTINVVLTRPFAQVNVGVTAEDWEAAVASGIEIEKSAVIINNAATAINLLTGEVSGAQEVSYALNAIPKETLEAETDNAKEGKEQYHWLSMSYILVNETGAQDADGDGTWGDARTTLDGLSFTFAPESGNNITFANGLNSVPVQRNYRTNIVGKILTGDIQFNITVDAAFKGEHPVYTNIEVSSEEDLITALNNVSDGGTIHLTKDITLANTLSTPAGKTITIDFAGKDFSVDNPTTTYAIRNLGTLILKDSKHSQKSSRAYRARGIYNGYAEDGTIVPEAKIIVESGEYNALGTDGGAAIFNYGIAEIKGGTFTSIGSYSLSNQSGAKMTIYEGVSANNGIYNTGAELVINGGEIEGNRSGCHVIYAWNSNVTINGGTIHNNNSGNSTLMAAGTSTMTVNGGTFTINIVDAASSYLVDAQNSATYNITGGSFTGGVRAQSGTGYEISGGTFANEYGNYNVYGSASISGGTFVGSYAQQFANKYCAEGYKAFEANGKYVIFPESVGGYATTEIENMEGVTYTGDFFENSKANALYFKNWILEGDATIKVVDKTYGAIILEGVKANLNGDAIVIDNDNNSVMILANCDFTLAEGKKLIKSTNKIYQVFMTDITINGVKLTNENANQYLENVEWFQVVEEI